MSFLKHCNLYTFSILLVTLAFSILAEAKVVVRTDAKTQLISWIYIDQGVRLKIAQLTPDQVQGFYIARGFSSKISKQLSQSCMMQIVAKNTASTSEGDVFTINLKDWKIRSNKKGAQLEQGLKLKENWSAEWVKEDVSKASKIAFRWATFPTEQNFEPSGDYNWGMASFGLTEQSVFDLLIVWHQNEEKKQFLIKELRCAASTEE